MDDHRQESSRNRRVRKGASQNRLQPTSQSPRRLVRFFFFFVSLLSDDKNISSTACGVPIYYRVGGGVSERMREKSEKSENGAGSLAARAVCKSLVLKDAGDHRGTFFFVTPFFWRFRTPSPQSHDEMKLNVIITPMCVCIPAIWRHHSTS